MGDGNLLNTESQVATLKNYLISAKPNKVSDADFPHFIEHFDKILVTLKAENVDDKSRLLLTDSLGIWLLRSTQYLNHKYLETAEYKAVIETSLLTKENSTFIFRYVVDFWSDSGAPLANSLRDVFNKLIQLLKVVYADEVTELFQSWVNEILRIPRTMRVLYFLLEVLSTELDLMVILEKDPMFIRTSLSYMWSDSLSNPIGKCLSSLLVNIYRRSYTVKTLDDWLSLWEEPTIYYLQDSRFTKRIELYILSTIFKSVPPDAFNKFIKRNLLHNTRLLLPLLKIGQELAIEEEPFHQDRLISTQTIETLLHQDVHKLHAFELLTYSSKRSKPIQPYIYDIIKQNLDIFFVDCELETRNYFHSSFKRFVNRARDSSYSLHRDAMKLKAKGKFPDEQKDKLLQVEKAHAFMAWLLGFLKKQMAPGTQYQRNSLAYKFIKTLLVSGLDDTVPEKFLDPKQRMEYTFHIKIFDPSIIRILCDNLTNNYDDIRQMSLELLLIAFQTTESQNLLELVDTDRLRQKGLQLLTLYKGGEGGANVLGFLFEISSEKGQFVQNLLNILKEYVTSAELDLIGTVEKPVSGVFAALSSVLVKYDFKECEETYQIVENCIELISANWKTVQDVLCYDSPDGNLPVSYLDCGVSDQLITSYAFRSIKESSDLLSTLMSRAPLSKDQLAECGKLLMFQLSNIRHSGAFQSVFPCFVSCCARCNRDIPEELEVWLKETINSLQTKTQHITRRSGGLPFLIIAILSSEKNASRPMLKYTFDTLIEIAEIPILEHEDKLDLPQVNAFNCIKTLFVESKLSEPCTPYVYPALSLCLKYFTSPVWAMRNCSIMLFTALQNRLFGKVGKNMSARLFFTRYQGIREVLLEKLQQSVGINPMSAIDLSANLESSLTPVTEQSKIESIFLVLTVLSRLKQTPGYNGLDDFKAEVLRCLENKNWKIREMAARALPALGKSPYSEAVELWKDFAVNAKSQNTIHGSLLAVKELIQSGLERFDSDPFPNELTLLILGRLPSFLQNNKCFVTSKIYVELVGVVLKNDTLITKTMRKGTVNQLAYYFVEQNGTYSVDGSKQLLLATVADILLNYESKDNITDTILVGLYSPFFEVQLITISFISANVDLDDEKNSEVVDKLVELLEDKNLWSHVKTSVLRALQKSSKHLSPRVLTQILNRQESEDLQASALESLGSFTNEADDQFWSFIEKYSDDESPFHFRLSSLKCLIYFYQREKDAYVLFKIYQMLSDDESEIRELAALFLNQNFLKLGAEELKTAPSITAKMFIEAFIREFPERIISGVVLKALKHSDLHFDFHRAQNTVCEELFAVEKDNQYRNSIEQALQIITLAKLTKTDKQAVKNHVDTSVTRLTINLERAATNDDVLGWGSEPDLFAEIVVLRNLVQCFAASKLKSLDMTLHKVNCHPLVFEIAL